MKIRTSLLGVALLSCAALPVSFAEEKLYHNDLLSELQFYLDAAAEAATESKNPAEMEHLLESVSDIEDDVLQTFHRLKEMGHINKDYLNRFKEDVEITGKQVEKLIFRAQDAINNGITQIEADILTTIDDATGVPEKFRKKFENKTEKKIETHIDRMKKRMNSVKQNLKKQGVAPEDISSFMKDAEVQIENIQERKDDFKPQDAFRTLRMFEDKMFDINRVADVMQNVVPEDALQKLEEVAGTGVINDASKKEIQKFIENGNMIGAFKMLHKAEESYKTKERDQRQEDRRELRQKTHKEIRDDYKDLKEGNINPEDFENRLETHVEDWQEKRFADIREGYEKHKERRGKAEEKVLEVLKAKDIKSYEKVKNLFNERHDIQVLNEEAQKERVEIRKQEREKVRSLRTKLLNGEIDEDAFEDERERIEDEREDAQVRIHKDNFEKVRVHHKNIQENVLEHIKEIRPEVYDTARKYVDKQREFVQDRFEENSKKRDQLRDRKDEFQEKRQEFRKKVQQKIEERKIVPITEEQKKEFQKEKGTFQNMRHEIKEENLEMKHEIKKNLNIQKENMRERFQNLKEKRNDARVSIPLKQPKVNVVSGATKVSGEAQ
jgi:hypothetical protein